MLQFLQQNAEWMCAIAIVIFSAIQCWIAHTQIKQELRLRRLNLARELENLFAKFPTTKKQCRDLDFWLSSNFSLFLFLLKEKDFDKYEHLCDYIAILQSQKGTKIEDLDGLFYVYLGDLVRTLANANYPLVKFDKV